MRHSRQMVSPPSRHLPRFPLLVVLVVPFLLEILIVVGLTGYLSFRNGQQAVNNLANQLINEVSDRTSDQLGAYLKTPPAIARMTASTIELGLLNLTDLPTAGRYFQQKHRLYPDISSIGLANSRGEFVGTYLAAESQPVIEVLKKSPDARFYYSKVGENGNLAESIESDSPFPGITSSQFTNAIATGKPAWGEINQWSRHPGLGISFHQPVYGRNRTLLGVLTVEDSLTQIDQFLHRLQLSPKGRIFIVESSGLLVASSSDEPPYDLVDGKVQRIKASRSYDFLISETAAYLNAHFGSFQNIKTPQQLNFDIEDDQQFVQVKPYTDEFGLDWLIVTVVPESDFMADIQNNTRTTLLLCAGALLLAIALGGLTAQWIARPILRLSRASRNLTLGRWDYPVAEKSQIAELEVLARSFNQMAVHLHESFGQVTTALEKSEEKFTKIFRSSPDPMAIATLDGLYLEVNDSFLNLFGYSREEVVGHRHREVPLWADPADRRAYIEELRARGQILNREETFQTKSGELLTVLFSSEIIELQDRHCIIGAVRDITERKRSEEERKRAEAALRESEERFRCAFATSAVGMNIASLEGQFLQVNPAFCRMLGYTEPEILKLTFYQITHPQDLEEELEYTQQLLNGTLPYYHMKKRYLHKDGHIIPGLLSVSLIRDCEQNPLYFVAHIQDLNEHQHHRDPGGTKECLCASGVEF